MSRILIIITALSRSILVLLIGQNMLKSINYKQLLHTFKIPLIVLFGILFYGVLVLIGLKFIGIPLILATILLGSYGLFKETWVSLMKKQYALDYIAIIAIVVAVITQQYLVAAILALMVSSGSTLEAYGVTQAKKSLTQLIDRIPTDVVMWTKTGPGKKEKLVNIHVDDKIFIRKGEVIALDGVLESETGETDESSLTGEPYFIQKRQGDMMRSGTINIGTPVVICVTKTEEDSTYKKIVDMVKKAENEKSPMVRLADQYSTIFTIITFIISVFAYIVSDYDLSRVLAVLAIATPCPLIIATPIALLGGVNASAKRKIIIKKLAALEVLSRIQTIVFDKTGTITLGKPRVMELSVHEGYEKENILRVAAAIERNSLHPLAKAIVEEAKDKKVPSSFAKNIEEIIGVGISGEVDGKKYMLAKLNENNGMAIGVSIDKKQIAKFIFADEIKEESRTIIRELKDIGLSLHIFTGDKREAAQKIVAQLGESVYINAEMSPEDKQKGIKDLKDKKHIIAMVGDGINDAPALALADVGMAFSNQEQTAASEAADIVFLGGDFSMVYTAWKISRRTIMIARQSIQWGIGLSIIGMVFASVGLIPPLFGAGLQEAIDVTVILNALRASR